MNYILLATILILAPFFCGLLPLRLMKEEHRSIISSYVIGWFVMFAVFEIVSVPMIYRKMSFHLLTEVFRVILLVVILAGIIAGRKIVLPLMKKVPEGWKNQTVWTKILWILFILLVLGQMLFLMFYQYIDGDDAYYLAVSLDAMTDDSMYLRAAYTGYPYTIVEIRHALSPVPIFIAWLSKLTNIHPTILSHSVLGPVWIGVMYLVYVLIGRRLFREYRRWCVLFVLFIMLFYVFGHVSLYTAETFAYTRTWQGKSILPNLVIPMLYLTLLYLMEEKNRIGEWMLIFCLVLSAVFATAVSVPFIAVFIALAGAFMFLRSKKWSDIFGMVICLIPCLVFGLLYMIQ